MIEQEQHTKVVLELRCSDCKWTTNLTLIDFDPFMMDSDDYMQPATEICDLHEKRTGHTTNILFRK
jgi:hypothetical protein